MLREFGAFGSFNGSLRDLYNALAVGVYIALGFRVWGFGFSLELSGLNPLGAASRICSIDSS